MRSIKEYRVTDHFNTRGTIPLGFDDVASGVGRSPAEAIQGALDFLAGNGWNVAGLNAQILAERDWNRDVAAEDGSSYFVSVYVR